jgi:beta-1,4-mannosyltransferase
MEKIANLSLTNITIQTMWLEAGDYPRLLGCADLGVSLHTSTSGIDLPMKVVDMFGCQVPVCAMGYDCIDELVQDTVNGRIFKRSEELCQLLFQLLFSNHGPLLLNDYRQNICGIVKWAENWNQVVRDDFFELCTNHSKKLKAI